MLMLANAFMQPPRTTLKPHAIDARRVRRVSLTAAPNSNEIDVQRTLATLIAAQVILFVGVAAMAAPPGWCKDEPDLVRYPVVVATDAANGLSCV